MLGMSQADLARATGIKDKTIGSIMEGRSHTPQGHNRARLDAFLVAPGPDGTRLPITWWICTGRLTRYPGLEYRAVAAQLLAGGAEPAPPSAGR